VTAAAGREPRGPDPEAPDPGTLVRPYTLTRGRTSASDPWPPETVVSATGRVPAPRTCEPSVGDADPDDGSPGTAPRDDGGPASAPEARAIVEAARPWRSLAEIAAGVRLPLGVVRVLVTDLADAGFVRVHRPDSGADTDQLERALRGLRARIPDDR
jgi:Protein of unknown function (DUF742)